MNKYQKQAMMYMIRLFFSLIVIPVTYYITHRSDEHVYAVLETICFLEIAFLFCCFAIYVCWEIISDCLEIKDKKEKEKNIF
jgi:hypothetical protein